MSGSDQPNGVVPASRENAEGVGDPRPAAVSFLTTEHFTLQGARSATISESTDTGACASVSNRVSESSVKPVHARGARRSGVRQDPS